MILQVIRVLLLFPFLLVTLDSNSQSIKTFSEEYSFLRYLANNRLYDERLYVLNSLSDSAVSQDRINIEKGWTFQAKGDMNVSISYYQKAPLQSIVKLGFQDNYLDLLFRTKNLPTLESTLQSTILPVSIERAKIEVSLNLLNAKLDPELLSDSIPENITLSYKKYFRANRKSAFLGGLYSAVIPGMGKLYAGKRRQAWGLFMANVIFGLQTYEAYRKTGMSPRFYFFGGLFSITYLSNIYGSASSVRKIKRDSKDQLHYEISQYYLQHSGYYNYPL